MSRKPEGNALSVLLVVLAISDRGVKDHFVFRVFFEDVQMLRREV
jgi:hypothetical protein